MKQSKILRSLLFIPADSEKKLAKAVDINADAIVLDLEDAVLPERKSIARDMCAEFLKSVRPTAEVWVRINPLDTDLWRDDLAAIIAHNPAGLMLPKPDGPADIETLSQCLDKMESELGHKDEQLRILPVATETATAVTTLNMYPRTHLPRLYGLTWGIEDLATDIGAYCNRTNAGTPAFPFDVVRAQMLFAAKASKVEAVDTLFADFRDFDGLSKYAKHAYNIGFSGMLAIHPAQVDIINEAFTPTNEQIDHAQNVVQAFADNPGAGAVSVDGKMTDIPHLKQAQRILAQTQKIGMPIYVDNVRIPYRGMLMSHMTADTLDEIHEMADRLEIFRKYFQYPPKTRFPHYDIPVDRRDRALALGAHAVDRRSSLHYGAKLGIEWIQTQTEIIVPNKLISNYERTILRTQNYAIKIA